MNTQRTKLSHLIGLILFSALIMFSGCKHQLGVRNIDDYTIYRNTPLKKNLSIGLVTESDDVYCQIIANGIADSLGKYSTDVMMLNDSSELKKVDVLAEVLITPEYKGSGWNFWINFPGFIVFAPAWNGYVYKVNYNVGIKPGQSLLK